MAMPAEIFDTILDHTLDGQVYLLRDMNGQGFSWDQSWVWKLLLVSKGFSCHARRSIVKNAMLNMVGLTRGQLLVDAPYNFAEGSDHTLVFGGFPAYIQQGAKVASLFQAQTQAMLKIDRVNVEQLNSVRTVVIIPGYLQPMLTNFVLRCIKSLPDSTSIQMATKFAKFDEAMSRCIEPKDKAKFTAACQSQISRLLSVFINLESSKSMFAPTVACCLTSSQTSAEKFFTHLTKEELGITRGAFESLSPEAKVSVTYVDEIHGEKAHVSIQPT